MNELPFRISSILSYGIALTIFVVTFISVRYALQRLRRKSPRQT